MAGNGQTKKLVASVEYNPQTQEVHYSMPEEISHAYVLAKMLMDGVMQRALNPEAERKVKTLDELGVNPLRVVKS